MVRPIRTIQGQCRHFPVDEATLPHHARVQIPNGWSFPAMPSPSMTASPLHAVRVTGPDAADFLNRLLTCAVKSLAASPVESGTHPWIPGCLLGGDGRIRQEVIVVRVDGSDFLLVPLGPGRPLPEGDEGLYEALDGYLFTEQVQLVRLPVRVTYRDQVSGVKVGQCSGVVEFLDGMAPLDLGVDFITQGDGLRVEAVSIGDHDPADEFPVAGSGILEAGLSLGSYEPESAPVQDGVDLATFPVGIPMLGRDYGHQNLPLEVGLKSAVSFTKGCFPGQEIMARIENLGHPAKVLVHLEATATRTPLESGWRLLTIKDDGTSQEVGTVTSSTVHADRVRAVAMVKWDWREAGTSLLAQSGDCAVSQTVTVKGMVAKYPALPGN
jgi:folate-binding protein YgfZ